jgi:TolB-like protein/Tfp pilus assembly protein PilF
MTFCFAGYTIDVGRRELRLQEEVVHVEPQVFDVLVYLIENRDRVVTKNDLFAAVWQGRIVSETTLSSRINAARRAIGDTGEKQQMIRTVARKGVRFVAPVHENSIPATAKAPEGTTHSADRDVPERISAEPPPRAGEDSDVLPLPDRPSIAVLPFANLSSDPEQEYFADGIVEDIITALSRARWLFVIARNSSFTYKGRAVDIKQVGRELGVRYVLEGSVRNASGRVRIYGQLVDASTGVHIWADRFEGALGDIFALQDQVTTSVIGALIPKLEQAEIERVKRKPIQSLDAYDHYLRGLAVVYRWTRDANKEALRLFYRAIELDPDFALAYGFAAWCYSQRKANRWVTDRSHETSEALRLAYAAVELGKDDAAALAKGGDSIAFSGGDLDTGGLYLDRALALNPNHAFAWFASAWVKIWLGSPETALQHLTHVVRLSPLDPNVAGVRVTIAFAHYFAGRYDEASSCAQQILRETPNFHMALRMAAAGNALAGRLDIAQKAMARLREIDPTLRVSNLGDLTALRRPEDMARYAEGLRRAGLPE